MPIRRKCIYCHNYIDVQKDVGTYIYQNNGAISHIECFSNYKKSLKVPWSQRKINEYIGFAQKQTKSSMEELIKEEQKKKAKKESKQAAGERSSSARRILTDWLLERYNITMPKAFFVRLDSVYKGTYRGLAQPIPPEHLLDMWQQKINYLDKVAEQNRKKGKEVDGPSRLNYDLAIIVARYPAYLTWLKKQQIAAEQSVETTRQQHIDYLNTQSILQAYLFWAASLLLSRMGTEKLSQIYAKL